MSQPVSRSGFALLMVLVLVLVAGVALAALASRSLHRSVQAKGEVEAVQRKWAVASARATLLERADVLLYEAERTDPDAAGDGGAAEADAEDDAFYRPLRRIELSTTLAGFNYRFVIGDEQTKANVNAMIHRLGRADAQHVLADLLSDRIGSQANADAELRLRTYEFGQPGDGDADYAAIVGYSQAFARVTPERLLSADPDRGIAGTVTCWGDGKLNFRRTPEHILEAVTEKSLRRSTIRRLLHARERRPNLTLDEAIVSFDDNEQQLVRRHLTDASTTFSLWIVVRNNQRSWHHLAVTGGGFSVASAPDSDESPAAGEALASTMPTPLYFSW